MALQMLFDDVALDCWLCWLGLMGVGAQQHLKLFRFPIPVDARKKIGLKREFSGDLDPGLGHTPFVDI